MLKYQKTSPSGSDLNQPIEPLVNNGNEIENNKAENNPAVVPPIIRTNAKTTIHVKEPKTTGNKIVKSYKFHFHQKSNKLLQQLDAT